MPIYEYEARDPEVSCPKCRSKFSTLQRASEEALTACEFCGSPIRRLVSKAQFTTSAGLTPEKAAQHGFTTFKKAGPGQWEKVAGKGVDGIIGDPAAAAAPAPTKVYDLDSE